MAVLSDGFHVLAYDISHSRRIGTRRELVDKEKLALQNVARAAIETNFEFYPASVTGYLGCCAQHEAL